MHVVETIRFADEELRHEIDVEIERITATLPPDASCLLTGSIVEGLGNRHSDIDVYVVHGELAGSNPVAIGMRKSRYVDCEYMTLGTLEKLAARIDGYVPRDLLDLSIFDIDRHYRIAIAARARVAPDAEAVFDRFERESSCRVAAEWSEFTAFEMTARAAGELAVRAHRDATVLLRYAALWSANAELAAVGEGYGSSHKWIVEKAARRFGRGSADYRRLLSDVLDSSSTPRQLLDRMRSRVVPPAGLEAALTGRGCAFVPGVRHYPGADVDVLVRGKAQLVEVDGVAALVCRALAAGSGWATMTAELAARLGGSEQEAAVAAWHATAPLRNAKVMVPVDAAERAAGRGDEEKS